MLAINHRGLSTTRGLGSLLIGLLLALALTLPARAADRLLSVEEHAMWQAIGRVNQAGFKSRSLCTGTLIAPDLVLTAAHCFDPDRSDPVVFVAGWYRGEKAGSSVVATFHLPDAYRPTIHPTMWSIGFDWALLVLETPIVNVAPIPFAEPRRRASVELIAYSGNRPHALSSRGPCRQRERVDTVMLLECSSVPGNSGGPVLQWIEAQWRVVGVVSAVLHRAETAAVIPGPEITALTR